MATLTTTTLPPFSIGWVCALIALLLVIVFFATSAGIFTDVRLVGVLILLTLSRLLP